MEATAATGLHPFTVQLGAAKRAGAGVGVGWRCAPGQRRLRRGARVVARLDGGVGKGVPSTNYVVPILGVDCRLTFLSELWLIADILGVQSTCLLKLSGLVPGTQNYNQQRPSQELVAKDLHGTEWKFRHIYRGATCSLSMYVDS
ncbi:hypothetical protein ZWY2020_033310 [Hordeum vulgare]|nr:hypothetical protein ZWY2020_033310 [Hordeum vulgare]